MDSYLCYCSTHTVDTIREYGVQWSQLIMSDNAADVNIAYTTMLSMIGYDTMFVMSTLPIVLQHNKYMHSYKPYNFCHDTIHDRYGKHIEDSIASAMEGWIPTPDQWIMRLRHVQDEVAYMVNLSCVNNGMRNPVIRVYHGTQSDVIGEERRNGNTIDMVVSTNFFAVLTLSFSTVYSSIHRRTGVMDYNEQIASYSSYRDYIRSKRHDSTNYAVNDAMHAIYNKIREDNAMRGRKDCW